MKKFILSTLCAVMALSTSKSFLSNADGEIPYFYMKMKSTEGFTEDADGTVVISREQIKKGIPITVDIFFYDRNENAWSVSPRWKTSSDFLVISQVYNPFEMDTVPPFAYASVDSSGNLTTGGLGYDISKNKKYGSINFTIRDTSGKNLVKYGETTDSYPLISFDISLDQNTPYGEYEVYFMAEEDNSCRVAINDGNGTIYAYPDLPRMENLKIRVEGANLGDINNDGIIDSKDASIVLSEYASDFTSGESVIDDTQKWAANVNFDNIIDSTDASNILNYYAYVSTVQENPLSMSEYFNLEN